ncbi:hypothetical protein BU15DRAFT_66904 [Melanogaster broomeanus]|nr:hypothetical protein BU15DRAFT_66904 [Melanogaster broomeanus]
MSKMDPACPVFDHAVPLTLPTCYPTVLPTHPSPLPSYPPIFNPVGVLSVAPTVLACLRPHHIPAGIPLMGVPAGLYLLTRTRTHTRAAGVGISWGVGGGTTTGTPGYTRANP